MTDVSDLTDLTGTTAVDWQGTASVIIPTYNESGNIGPLISRLSAVLPHQRTEIIVVDDSSDSTPDEVLEMARCTSIPVRLLHRTPAERVGGLGGAVLRGLASARGDWIVVMDGDLQHPPEVVPNLLRQKDSGQADAVVASRYLDGGSASGLADAWRRVGSSGAGSLAKALFPRALRGCSDPMSGFFAVRAETVRGLDLQPRGFKILLEILTRAKTFRIQEVPFVFGDRLAGESKADLRQALVYLRQLVTLRTRGTPGKVAGFLAVGASGLIPNLLAMAELDRIGVHYLAATVLATLLAISWNFALSDALLFRKQRHGRRLGVRYLRYVMLNLADVVVRVPLMALLVGVLGLHVLIATLLSTILASGARFVAVDRLIYRAPRTAPVLVPNPQLSLD